MSITIGDDGVIFKDANPILFPSDGNYRPSAFLSGLSGEDIVLAQFTPDGKLKVDATIEIGDITIGDVNLNLQVGAGVQLWSGVLNPDATTYAGFVQDQRMSFTGGSLDVNVTSSSSVDVVGLKNAADVRINPATEDTLASVLTDLNKFTFLSTRLLVDGSGVTQPVSAVALPLPAGASTSANQLTEIGSLSSIDGKLNSLGQKLMSGSVPVVIAFDQTTIPVSIAASPIASGYYFFDSQVSGTIGPAVDELYDFGQINRDVFLNFDQDVSIRWNTTLSTSIDLLAGSYSFDNQRAQYIYITTTVPTNAQIYANGD